MLLHSSFPGFINPLQLESGEFTVDTQDKKKNAVLPSAKIGEEIF